MCRLTPTTENYSLYNHALAYEDVHRQTDLLLELELLKLKCEQKHYPEDAMEAITVCKDRVLAIAYDLEAIAEQWDAIGSIEPF